MAKRLVLFLVAIILIAAGGGYYLLNSTIDSKFNEALTKNSLFLVKKSELNKGLNYSSGYVEGKITKDRIQFSIIEFLNEIKELSGASEDIDLMTRLVREDGVIDDIDFRSDFIITHRLLDAGKVIVDSNITIITPKYAQISKEIFNTDKPIELRVINDGTTSKNIVKFADIMGKNSDKLTGSVIEFTKMDEKIKDLAFKINDITVSERLSITLKDLLLDFKFEKPLAKFRDIFDTNYITKVSISNFVLDDGSMNFTIRNLTSNGECTNDANILKAKSKTDIGEIIVYNINFKNLAYKDELEIDKNLYNFISFKFKHLGENELLDKLKANFGKGMKYDIKSSIENLNGKKLNFDLNFDINKLSEDRDEMIKSINYGGKIALNSTFTDFFAPYSDLAIFGMLADSYEGFISENGSKIMNFSHNNGEFLLNGTKAENPLNSFIPDLAANQESQADQESEIAKVATHLDYLVTDIGAYYTSQGKFSEDGITYMTNAPLQQKSPNSAELLVSGQRCIEVKVMNDTLYIHKGADMSDSICKEFYEIQRVKNHLERSPIIFKVNR